MRPLIVVDVVVVGVYFFLVIATPWLIQIPEIIIKTLKLHTVNKNI